jgi:hypothetical protein
MILFNKRCEICGKPTSDQYVNEIDDHIICIHHFRMLLEAGLLFEGMDDKWHFMFVHEKDVKELIKML